MTGRALTAAAREAAASADREALRAALVAAGGVVADAQRALGWSRATIYRRLTSTGLAAWLEETYPGRISEGQTRRRAREKEQRPA